jgi:hypothetical protein
MRIKRTAPLSHQPLPIFPFHERCIVVIGPVPAFLTGEKFLSDLYLKVFLQVVCFHFVINIPALFGLFANSNAIF